jgi:hypothetical protein
MSIVLNTGEDRIAPLIRALEHSFATYDCVDFVVEGRRYAEADGPYRREEIVDLVAECSIEGFVGASPRVEL